MNRTRILVVEDDRKTAAAVKLYLEQAGMEAVLAHDGPGGLKEARTGRYDLLVLDLMLPGMDGLELCRKLRRTHNMPVIMLCMPPTFPRRSMMTPRVSANSAMAWLNPLMMKFGSTKALKAKYPMFWGRVFRVMRIRNGGSLPS